MVHDIFALWNDNKTRLEDIKDTHTRTKYLLTRNQSDARNEYQKIISKCQFANMSTYKPDVSMLSLFPQFSFALFLTFELASPYLSKDDESYYIIDNPLRKDKIFKVPMISGSSWKGNLRSAIYLSKGLLSNDNIIELFGNEKDKADNAPYKRGRLNFYPTFFDRISLEVINPHDRRTKAGTMPIYIESVPAGTTGLFSLLYVPFDLIGKPHAEVREKACTDLSLVCDSLSAMMLKYGFSAKRSAGFGIVEKDIKGTLEMAGVGLQTERKMDKKIEDSPFAKLAKLSIGAEKDDKFSNFDELKSLAQRIRTRVNQNGK